MPTQYTCAHCGMPFRTYPSRIALGEGRYCSQACARAAHAARRIDETARFWLHVDQSGDCWTWSGGHDWDGYGLFTTAQNKSVRAHRYSWQLANGAIPAGLFVCHTCDNPACVRPEHLWLGTPLDNARDMARKGRRVKPRTRLSPDDVRAIRAEFAAGERSTSLLGRRYGVSPITIRDLLRGRTWRDV